MTQIPANGVNLNVEVRGQGPALLLLHGFTGGSATWAPHVDAWPGFTAVAVDLLGHGDSDCPADPQRYRMERCVEDLLALLDCLGIHQVAALGYSMGGRVALHLALGAPERLWALILESASPGIKDAAERQARVQSDTALAEAIEREGIESFVNRWEALPLFASQAHLPAAVRETLRCQRLRNDQRGLANSLRGIGAGVQEPLLGRLGEIQVPALLIVGAMDETYSALASQMAAVLPCAQVEVVPEVGHTVHLERPTAFSEMVRDFLNESLATEQRREDAKCR
jgi:2-succinyl-6-hydroxy-2,4-cyclohexadiene-1-carboxylate synthase